MKILKILFAFVLAIVGLTIFGKIRQKIAESPGASKSPTATANPKDPGLSPAGFFFLSRDYEKESSVIVMTVPNCPSSDSARAQELMASLGAAGVPTTGRQEIGGTFNDPEDMARFQKYMANVAMPLVIVRGWAKGNPRAEDVIAQYRAAK